MAHYLYIYIAILAVLVSQLRDRSVANRLHIHNPSIRAPFSVTHFVISGGYYRGSFEYVIRSIVQLGSIMRL